MPFMDKVLFYKEISELINGVRGAAKTNLPVTGVHMTQKCLSVIHCSRTCHPGRALTPVRLGGDVPRLCVDMPPRQQWLFFHIPFALSSPLSTGPPDRRASMSQTASGKGKNWRKNVRIRQAVSKHRRPSRASLWQTKELRARASTSGGPKRRQGASSGLSERSMMVLRQT